MGLAFSMSANYDHRVIKMSISQMITQANCSYTYAPINVLHAQSMGKVHHIPGQKKSWIYSRKQFAQWNKWLQSEKAA